MYRQQIDVGGFSPPQTIGIVLFDNPPTVPKIISGQSLVARQPVEAELRSTISVVLKTSYPLIIRSFESEMNICQAMLPKIVNVVLVPQKSLNNTLSKYPEKYTEDVDKNYSSIMTNIIQIELRHEKK